MKFHPPKSLCILVAVLIFLPFSQARSSFLDFIFPALKPEGLQVSTTSGEVVGSMGISRDGRQYYSWQGIPYAKPPIGNLRFQDPLPFGKWTGVWNARFSRKWCAQAYVVVPILFGSEDCLHLNIYTPKLDNESVLPKQLPVIFYIHGGAYAIGSGNEQSPDFFMDEDVVLVTINYRLGIFGFLSTGDRIVRGNMGLKDQLLALKWVYDNIEKFGGDPEKITLAGESAGGASVVYQMVAQKANGMFHRALALSGAAGSSWSLMTPERMRRQLERVAEQLQCPVESSQAFLDCMQQITTVEILLSVHIDTADFFLFSPHLDGDVFAPIVEEIDDSQSFLIKNPLKAFETQDVYQVPMMIGMMADEGLLGSLSFYANVNNMLTFEQDMIGGIKKVCGLPGRNESEVAQSNAIAQQIQDYYFSQARNDSSIQTRQKQFTKMFSDCFFNYQVYESAVEYRKYGRVHVYLYTRADGPSLAPIQVGIMGKTLRILEALASLLRFIFLEWVLGFNVRHRYGVSHADDIWMMFPFWPVDLFRVDQTHPGYSFSKDFVKLLVDFASGTEPLMFRGYNFPYVEPTSTNCGPILSVNDTASVITNPLTKRIQFLKRIGVR